MDSILFNPPISSPLHPQANLPLLKGYLKTHGFTSRVLDTNILFFHWFLKEIKFNLSMDEIYLDPIKILGEYARIEKALWESCKSYIGLSIGLRFLNMKYDRATFSQVILAIEDPHANPFIAFFNELLEKDVAPDPPKLIGIAITFQDQIIPAFTLASLIRKKFPHLQIALGGQMVTRCQDSMLKDAALCRMFDFLCLWDGEKTLLDVHRLVIQGEQIPLVNVLSPGRSDWVIDRNLNTPESSDIPSPDFSDIQFDRYLFPEFLVPIQTTRGCYGKCEFCAIPFGSNSYRIRPASKIIEDIITIQDYTLKRFGRKATLFKFMEDTSSPALLHEISVEIEKNKLDVKWETFARLEKTFAKPGFMGQLFRGGCRKVHWGLESNDPDILRNMNKKTTQSFSDQVLSAAAKAGILNFCFVLVGFPGESDSARQSMVDYIIQNKNIHTITLATFDLTRGSPMEQNFSRDNEFKIDIAPAVDFQVRLPYLVDGKNWKEKIVPAGHQMMYAIIQHRPDIGFMTLFPDQIRSLFCDRYSNRWGDIFLDRYGKANIQSILQNTQKYINDFKEKAEIDPDLLPEPLKREHFRTKEDMQLIANAILSRKKYEERRTDQV